MTKDVCIPIAIVKLYATTTMNKHINQC